MKSWGLMSRTVTARPMAVVVNAVGEWVVVYAAAAEENGKTRKDGWMHRWPRAPMAATPRAPPGLPGVSHKNIPADEGRGQGVGPSRGALVRPPHHRSQRRSIGGAEGELGRQAFSGNGGPPPPRPPPHGREAAEGEGCKGQGARAWRGVGVGWEKKEGPTNEARHIGCGEPPVTGRSPHRVP